METTHHALLEYARATYGADAKVRPMTELQTGNPIFLQAAICKDKSTCSSDPTAATILGDE